MKMHRISTEQILPISLDEAWDFFSTPDNLNEITPEDMSFKILSGSGERTFAGQIISYKVRPLFNIPLSWVTEIVQVVEGKYFIDEQRFGPYKFWHHRHHFEAHPDGVLMKDTLHYVLPFGILGEIMGSIFIHDKVKGIFSYREEKLKQLFPKK